MVVLAARLLFSAAAAAVHALEQADQEDLNEQVDVGHDHLEPIGLVNLIADIFVPVWRVISISSLEISPEELGWVLLQIHIQNQDNQTCVEELSDEYNIDNFSHLLGYCRVSDPLNQVKTDIGEDQVDKDSDDGDEETQHIGEALLVIQDLASIINSLIFQVFLHFSANLIFTHVVHFGFGFCLEESAFSDVFGDLE